MSTIINKYVKTQRLEEEKKMKTPSSQREVKRWCRDDKSLKLLSSFLFSLGDTHQNSVHLFSLILLSHRPLCFKGNDYETLTCSFT